MYKINIKPRNKDKKPHGYWEIYYDNGILNFKGLYVNGYRHGYWEECLEDGDIYYKGYYNMNKITNGLWIETLLRDNNWTLAYTYYII